MMRHEFEERVAKLTKNPNFTISPENWDRIEYIYMHHPLIKNATGKDQIAQYYVSGLWHDMEPVALEAGALEDELNRYNRERKDLEAERQRARDDLDKARKALDEKYDAIFGEMSLKRDAEFEKLRLLKNRYKN